jgi:hypothetical protein
VDVHLAGSSRLYYFLRLPLLGFGRRPPDRLENIDVEIELGFPINDVQLTGGSYAFYFLRSYTTEQSLDFVFVTGLSSFPFLVGFQRTEISSRLYITQWM